MIKYDIYIDYDKIHEKLRRSGYTTTEVANICGIGRQTFYKKLNGEREFKVIEFIRLCFVLDIPISAAIKIIKRD